MNIRNRRGFIGAIGAALAGATLDPERLLWVPGAKCISIPSQMQDYLVSNSGMTMFPLCDQSGSLTSITAYWVARMVSGRIVSVRRKDVDFSVHANGVAGVIDRMMSMPDFKLPQIPFRLIGDLNLA